MADVPNINYRQLTQIQSAILGVASTLKNIQILTYDNTGVIDNNILVPVLFGQNNNVFDIANGHTYIHQTLPDNETLTSYCLPAMSLTWLDMINDADRKQNQMAEANCEEGIRIGVPFKLFVSLDIITKSVNHLEQIICQILPRYANQLPVKFDYGFGLRDSIIVSIMDITVDVPSDLSMSAIEETKAILNMEVSIKVFRLPQETTDIPAGYSFEVINKDINETVIPEG